jgi:DME family drug/metabolite transporter
LIRLAASTPRTAHLALAAACGAAFLWGTGALVVNVPVVRHGFTPQNISFWRFAVRAAVLPAVSGPHG